MFKNSLIALSFVVLTVSQSAFAAKDVSVENIKIGYKKHAVLAQLHRWYLLYEEPAYGVANQLDILHKDIFVKSSLGEAKGHDVYRERVKNIPQSWKNAHHVKSTDISFDDANNVNMTVEITYLNVGALPNGALRSAELSYATKLVPTESVLPKFTEIVISQNKVGTPEKFVSAYSHNRTRSLVHYWLALIEDPTRDPEPVKEILADDFSLNFSSGAITEFDAFKKWLAGPASQVIASTHQVSNFSVIEQGDNRYQVKMDFDWNGILPNQTEMTAKTRHTWIVTDNSAERFARIKSMDVEVLEPFTPKK